MLNLKSQVINTCHIVKTETKMEAAKIVFIREGLITKKLKAFEGDIVETICLKVMVLFGL